jgi:hypothetical protein
MGLLSGIVKAIYKPLDIAITTFTHPFQVANAIISPTKTVSEVVAKTIAEPKAKQITDVLLAGASYAGIAGAAKSVATKGIVAASKAILPNTFKGKATLAATTLVAVPAAITNPKLVTQSTNYISKVPDKLTTFGSDVGELSKDPSLKKTLELVKDNPEVSIGLGLLTGGLGAKLLFPTAANVLANTFDNPKLPEIPKSIPVEIPKSIPVEIPKTKPSNLPKENNVSLTPIENTPANNSLATQTNLPQTAQTKTLSSSPRRKKTYKRIKPQSISQRVNVIIGNKTYINRGVYAR